MKIIKILSKIILSLIIIAILFVGILTLFEYRPKDLEEITITNNQTTKVQMDQVYQAMTFNIGYAGLGKDEDFVMDGGKKGRADDLSVVEDYFSGIKDILIDYPSDFYLLQEVDQSARRSYYLDQVQGIKDTLGQNFSSQYALNFKSIF